MKFKTFIRNLRTNNNPKVHLFKLVALAAMILGFVALMIFCNNKGQNRIFNCNGIVQTDKEKTYPIHENMDSIRMTADSVKLTEHRVYYVDYSYSMVDKPNNNVDGTGHTLLNLVKDNLKKSIRDIKDKDVSIDIIPFLDSVLWSNGKPNNIYKISKESGKGFDERKLEEMDDFIDNIEPIKKPNGRNYATHHSIVINDFLEERIKDAKQYHMMILLTDGADFSAGDKVLKEKWDNHIKGKSVFGIFVNLPKEDITGNLPELFKGKESQHRYFMKGTNFDFNVVELTKPSPVMIRKKNTALISIGGRCPKFKHTTQEDSFYRCTLTQPPSSSYLQIKVDTLAPKTNLPNEYKFKFKLEYDSVDNTQYFLSENKIELTIINQKTPNIDFSIAGKTTKTIPCISDRIRYCKKLFGCIDPEWSDTITIKIAYEKSDDAKSIEECNKSRLKINGLPNYVTLISKNEIPLNQPSDTLSVQLVLDLTKNFSNDSIISGSVEMTGVENFKSVFINDYPLNGKENSTIIGAFRFSTDKCLNPWVIRILCILAILFLLWLLSMEYIKYRRSKKPRFNTNIMLQFYTEPEDAGILFNENCIILENRIDKKFLKEYIGCISLKVGVTEKSHNIWSMREWWNIKSALKGDIHTLHLDENELVSEIKLRPANNGGYEISCYKDNIQEEKTIRISKINEEQEIYSITKNGAEIRFCVKGLRPAVIN